MKKFLSILTLLVFTVPAFAATRYVTTSTPLKNNYYNNYSADNYANSRLTDMEMSVFGRNYYGQNITTRLSRLEQAMFNRTYPNSTIEQRLDSLTANYNNNTNFTPVNSSGKIKSIINGVSSSLFGTATGMTPPINPYYSYGRGGYGSNYGNYRDYYGTDGWRMRNNSIGTGTGIHIID